MRFELFEMVSIYALHSATVMAEFIMSIDKLMQVNGLRTSRASLAAIYVGRANWLRTAATDESEARPALAVSYDWKVWDDLKTGADVAGGKAMERFMIDNFSIGII